MDSLHKVLLVASSEASREPAYEVSAFLREHGYATELCHASEDSKVNASQLLSADLGISGYDAVVFFDDGNDADACLELAKKAAEAKIVIGGTGVGVVVMGEAGLLNDEYVCSGLDGKFDGAQEVDAPSVRSGNFVTSTESCAIGFAILLLDALGGKIKKVIRSSETPSVSAMVIAPVAKWSNYWQVAKSMDAMGHRMAIASWDDIDIQSATARISATLDVRKGDVVLSSDMAMPASIWFMEDGLDAEGMASAIEKLESIGCHSINSPEAIRKSADKELVGEVLGLLSGSKPSRMVAKAAARAMMARGVRMAAALDGANVMVVRGLGDKAIMTRPDETSSMLVDADQLAGMLSVAFNRNDVLVSSVEPCLRVGPERLRLACLMAMTPRGWRASSLVAISEDGEVADGMMTLRVVLPDGEYSNEEIEEIARSAVMMFQSMLEGPGGMDLAQVMMGLDGDRLVPTDVSAILSGSFLLPTRMGNDRVAHVAQLVGQELEEKAAPRGTAMPDDVAMILSGKQERMHRLLLEREMAHNGIYPQMDGSVAMTTPDGTDRVPSTDELVDVLRTNAIRATREEERLARKGTDQERRMASRAARASRYRYMLARELRRLDSAQPTRKAELSTGVAGPYSHVELPMNERVFEWHEGDDWLTDKDEYIRKLPRYNPEYEKTNFEEPAGFYYTWDEPRRTPTDWIRTMEGDGVYPTRNILQRK